MSEANRKQEKDYTKEVDEALPKAQAIAKSGKLQEALDQLFTLEKQARNASDLKSTTRLVKAIIELAYQARDFQQLNSSIQTLSKKHGQLKAAIQEIVELSMTWLEDIERTEGTAKWLELVETLRTVTEGKIFLETPRARVTLLLAKYHENLAKTATTPPPRDSLITASELLSDLQVETYSSMERREKTEFILEQMRLLIIVARLKDSESGTDKNDPMGGGEAEWVKVRVGSRKINEEFLKQKENEDLKLKYYDMMVQHGLHHNAYLDVAKYYHKVWETPSIKEDESNKSQLALEHIAFYVVLAPHDNEQSDMMHRLFRDPALKKMDLHYNLLKSFTTEELMRWPGIEEVYGPFLRKSPVFEDDKHWEDLHNRVIEHNIRVIAKYYTRITLERLTSLLVLTPEQTEETLCRLVVSGTVWARIDRPAGIVSFRNKRSAEDVMNDWSSDMQKLLGLVEKAWMGMNAAQAAQSKVAKA
ncbi:PCI-domain-containing protein [Dentipellis sp. KUC8613]|nr:PCI-domain-containing protein [Dentipellis sp. KUC8613]